MRRPTPPFDAQTLRRLADHRIAESQKLVNATNDALRITRSIVGFHRGGSLRHRLNLTDEASTAPSPD